MTPSAMASFSLRRITRFMSTIYSTLPDRRHDHAGEFDLADAERAASAGSAEPAEEEARELPQGVEPEAARHDRVALEMAAEEPVETAVARHRQLGGDLAFAVRAARLGDGGDAVEHQHGGQRQLGVAGAEQLAAPARRRSSYSKLVRRSVMIPSLNSRLPEPWRRSSAAAAGFLTQSIGLQKGEGVVSQATICRLQAPASASCRRASRCL